MVAQVGQATVLLLGVAAMLFGVILSCGAGLHELQSPRGSRWWALACYGLALCFGLGLVVIACELVERTGIVRQAVQL